MIPCTQTNKATMKGLKGKTAIVTGASSGIGQSIAIRLAQEGCNIAINYRSDLEGAQTTKTEALNQAKDAGHEIRTLIVQADVAKAEAILAMMEKVNETWGGLDILINNAGIQIETPSHEVETDAFDKEIDVNLRGSYL